MHKTASKPHASFFKWVVKKREVKKSSGEKGEKKLLVVFLTKELHCGAAERGKISESLCFILEWLRRKIINTMKSKIFSGRSSRKQLFLPRRVFKVSSKVEKIKNNAARHWAAAARCVSGALMWGKAGMMGGNLSGWMGRWRANGLMHMGGWINPH